MESYLYGVYYVSFITDLRPQFEIKYLRNNGSGFYGLGFGGVFLVYFIFHSVPFQFIPNCQHLQ